MSTYEVKLRDFSIQIIVAENVHITAQGNVKFLNGQKHNAVLVAFFNAADVVSVTKQN